MSLSEWLAEATPDRREVTVCFDRRLVSKLEVANERLKAVRDEGMLGTGEEAATVDALAAQVREKTRVLVFEGIGWGRWRALLAKHPPEPDQAEVFARAVKLAFMPHALENIGFNAEGFIPAAIAASCVDPGMSEDEASRLLDDEAMVPSGTVVNIWNAVLKVNHAGYDDPLAEVVSAANSVAARPSAKKLKPLPR